MSKERVRFVLEWERRWKEGQGVVNMSELCREFGVTRECGYKWVGRFRDAGYEIAAVVERSRRPRRSPTAIEDKMQELVVAARKQKPKWGPVKLRAWLMARHPGVEFPSASAMAAILKRRGLVRVGKRRPQAGSLANVTAPFSNCQSANALWCVDFKGWFVTGDGVRCYPLTITDAYSRFVLRCEAMEDPNGTGVFAVFDSAFREFGLPTAIRSDGGPPFASTAAAGLTRLSVWWLQLGLRVERIAPGKPQQNGRHERMHRTLKLEVQPQANMRTQQRAFDLWRRAFNEERPHSALGQRTPSRVYEPSSVHYPRSLVRPEPHAWQHAARVDNNGAIRFLRRKVFVTSALCHLDVVLERSSETSWQVKWGEILLGSVDETALEDGIVPARRRKGSVSTMSLN